MKIFILSLLTCSVFAAFSRPPKFTEKNIFSLFEGISKFKQESYANLSKAETLQDLVSVFAHSFGFLISEPLFKYREAIIEKYQNLVSNKDLQEVLEEMDGADDDKWIYFHCISMSKYPEAASRMLFYGFDRRDFHWVKNHFDRLALVERAKSSGPNEEIIALIDKLVARAQQYAFDKEIDPFSHL